MNRIRFSALAVKFMFSYLASKSLPVGIGMGIGSGVLGRVGGFGLFLM
jgi:hypothetical protein